MTSFAPPDAAKDALPYNCDPYICIDNLEGNCRRPKPCLFFHCETPLQWQLQIQPDDWHDLPEDGNAALEEAYTDPNTEEVLLKTLLWNCRNAERNLQRILRGDLSSWKVEFASGPLCMVNISSNDVIELRRLCTPSSTVTNSRFASEWLWYYQDEKNFWCPLNQQAYGTNRSVSDIIEEVYNTGNVRCMLSISRSSTCVVDFNNWTLEERGTNAIQNIRFRPRLLTSRQEDQMKSGFVWEFLDMNSQWVPYGGVGIHGTVSVLNSEQIEQEYQKNKNGRVNFVTEDFQYVLDFSRMQQINLQTGTARNVRRFPKVSNSNKRKSDRYGNPQPFSSLPPSYQQLQSQQVSQKVQKSLSTYQTTGPSSYRRHDSSSIVSSDQKYRQQHSPLPDVIHNNITSPKTKNMVALPVHPFDAPVDTSNLPSLAQTDASSSLAVTAGVNPSSDDSYWIWISMDIDSTGVIIHVSEISVLTEDLLNMNLELLTKTYPLPGSEPVICVDYLTDGKCPKDPFCTRYHNSSTTYLWEVCTPGGLWISLPVNNSEELGKMYCDVSVERCTLDMSAIGQIQHSDHPLVVMLGGNNQWEAMFEQDMTLCDISTNRKVPLRRVSTPSSAVIGKSGYSTIWKWYHRNGQDWLRYGNVDGSDDNGSDVLEKMFSQGHKQGTIVSKGVHYDVDFVKWSHDVQDGKVTADVRRRPIRFVDEDHSGNLIDFYEVDQGINDLNLKEDTIAVQSLASADESKHIPGNASNDVSNENGTATIAVSNENGTAATIAASNENGSAATIAASNENGSAATIAASDENGTAATIAATPIPTFINSRYLTLIDNTENDDIKSIIKDFSLIQSNKVISNMYKVKNITLRRKYSDELKCLQTQNKTKVNEKHLYYITSDTLIDKICENNFLRGNGPTELKNYFQFISSVKEVYKVLEADLNNDLVVFVADVLVCNFTKYRPSMKDPVLGHPSVGNPFDTLVDDRHNPNYFLKFNEQFIPKFVIEFSNANCVAETAV